MERETRDNAIGCFLLIIGTLIFVPYCMHKEAEYMERLMEVKRKALADLPIYSGEDPTCEKCGSEGAAREWTIGGRTDDEEDVRFLGLEYWTRRCNDCGFKWKERRNDKP